MLQLFDLYSKARISSLLHDYIQKYFYELVMLVCPPRVIIRFNRGKDLGKMEIPVKCGTPRAILIKSGNYVALHLRVQLHLLMAIGGISSIHTE